MYKIALALALLATPVAAKAAESRWIGDWELVEEDDSCMIFASYKSGVGLSVWADNPGELTFMLSSEDWSSLREGAFYSLDVEFDDMGAWPVKALAVKGDKSYLRGVIFKRQTSTNSDGDNFLSEFMVAGTMYVSKGGRRISTLNLSGSHAAALGLAECIGGLKDVDPFKAIEPEPQRGSEPSIDVLTGGVRS